MKTPHAVAIMQPYLLPYIGYFQLIQAVEDFVFYDDVQYIRRGWINRNQILSRDKGTRGFTLKVQKKPRESLINEIEILGDGENRTEIINVFKNEYSHAPNFKCVMPLLSKIVQNPEKNLSKYIISSIKFLCEYLDIKTTFHTSSAKGERGDLGGQDRILYLCQEMDCDIYINPIGGMGLYKKQRFLAKNIELKFLKSSSGISYRQFSKPFTPNLSIVDLMMFCSVDELKCLLNEYELI